MPARHARYLDPRNGRFLTRDPWAGDRLRPQSMNGWNYVENNPINLVDPSGRTPATPNRFPEHCRTVLSEVAYDRCVRQHFNPGSVNDNTPRRKFGIDAVGEFISVRF